MDTAKFLSRHGDKWAEIKSDLLAVLDAQSPAHLADGLPIAVSKEQAETVNAEFTSTLRGYAKARRVITQLGETFVETPIEQPTFAKSPEELATQEATAEATFPTMPKPKNKKK